jgi:hypothetical protein
MILVLPIWPHQAFRHKICLLTLEWEKEFACWNRDAKADVNEFLRKSSVSKYGRLLPPSKKDKMFIKGNSAYTKSYN